jgi:hypothetical protein
MGCLQDEADKKAKAKAAEADSDDEAAAKKKAKEKVRNHLFCLFASITGVFQSCCRRQQRPKRKLPKLLKTLTMMLPLRRRRRKRWVTLTRCLPLHIIVNLHFTQEAAKAKAADSDDESAAKSKKVVRLFMLMTAPSFMACAGGEIEIQGEARSS